MRLSYGAPRIRFAIAYRRISQPEPRTSVFNRFALTTNRFPTFARCRRSLLRSREVLERSPRWNVWRSPTRRRVSSSDSTASCQLSFAVSGRRNAFRRRTDYPERVGDAKISSSGKPGRRIFVYGSRLNTWVARPGVSTSIKVRATPAIPARCCNSALQARNVRWVGSILEAAKVIRLEDQAWLSDRSAPSQAPAYKRRVPWVPRDREAFRHASPSQAGQARLAP